MQKIILLGLLLFFPLALCPTFAAKQKPFVIVIDPGHGGKDTGCKGNFVKEKDLVLQVALQVGREIEKNYDDVKVIYTRKTDVFPTLMDRTEKANKAKANLFLSIHADAIPTSKKKNAQAAYGAGTFTLGTARNDENLSVAMRENSVITLEDDYKTRYQGFDPNKPESYIIFEMMQNTHQTQSLEFADCIQNSLVKRGRRHNRDVRQAGFYVLRMAAMPSVLVEIGFLSNAAEEKYLSTTAGKENIAKSIYLGFVDYKKKWDKRNMANVEDEENVKPSKPEKTEKPAASTNKPSSATRQPSKPAESKPAASTNKPSSATRQPSKPAESKPAAASTSKPAAASTTPQKLTFKIQFLSSPKLHKKGDAALKGLWPVDYYKDGNVYKYTYGSSSSPKNLSQDMNTVKAKFKDAFIVKFGADGKRIK